MNNVINLFVPNPIITGDNLLNGERSVIAEAQATFTDEDGYIVAVNVTDEGIIIDLHTDDSGNPLSLSMMWEEWVDYLLQQGVR